MHAPYIFAANPLDRALALRHDEAWLRAQLADPRGRYLPLRELRSAAHGGHTPRLAWVDRDTACTIGAEADIVLLGLRDGVPHFAVACEGATDPAWEGVTFGDARALGAALPADEAGILAQARTMLDWHATHRFCGRCGGATTAIEGGARRLCTDCGARSYPQISPSIIVLVARGDRCLLARRPTAPPTRFTCLAGFLEPGESIEEAVAREVLEESGVHVGDVRYHSSQPWPFPANLMIGCLAQADSEQITVDGVEIAEARWFERDEVRRALAGAHDALTVPEPITISRHLIQAWTEQ